MARKWSGSEDFSPEIIVQEEGVIVRKGSVLNAPSRPYGAAALILRFNPGLRSLARTCPGLRSLAPTGPGRVRSRSESFARETSRLVGGVLFHVSKARRGAPGIVLLEASGVAEADPSPRLPHAWRGAPARGFSGGHGARSDVLRFLLTSIANCDTFIAICNGALRRIEPEGLPLRTGHEARRKNPLSA